MLKIKWMNYDASEYKMLEEELNTLSRKGYTCNSIDLLTVFKKTDTKAKYLTDVFYSTENTQFSKRKEKEEWITSYIDDGYYYIGKSRNIYVFKGTNKATKPKEDTTHLLPYFKGIRTILKMILLLLATALSLYFITTIFSSNAIDQFITNGAIIIHYIPVVICLTLTFRAMMNYYNNEQIKRKLKNKEAPILTNQNKYRRARLGYLYILTISILLLVSGVALDSLERKVEAVDKTKILTLEDFGIPGNTKEYNTYTTSSSVYIPTFYAYIEQSGDVDIKNGKYGNLLSIKYYTLKDQALANSFLDTLLYPNHSTTLKENVYLLQSSTSDKADTMIIKKDTTIVVVATSFDLTQEQYQQPILQKYQKRL